MGSNSIFGSVSATCLASGAGVCVSFDGDEGDAVAFTIGAGTELTAATLTISDLSAAGDATAQVFARSFADLNHLGTVGNGTYTLLDQGTLDGTQDYGVFPFLAFGTDPTGQKTLSFDWQLDLTTSSTAPVSPVPLPAGAVLILTALGGLAVIGRRKS